MEPLRRPTVTMECVGRTVKAEPLWRLVRRQNFNKESLMPTVKHGSRDVLVWSCIAVPRTRLLLSDLTMNSKSYERALEDTVNLLSER